MGGVSALFGIGALLGFLGFIAGLALVVVAASQGRPLRRSFTMAAIGLGIGLLLGIISRGIVIIEPTQVAVIINTLNGNLETPRRAGTSIITPIIQTSTLYPINQQEYTMSGRDDEGALRGNDAVSARTIDGQEVALDITVLYSIDPEQVNTVHLRWQNRYQDDFVRPTVRGFIRNVVSGFRAEEIYGEQRTAMQDAMEIRVRERFEREGLILTDLLVRDISFSEEFRQAIEQKQIAEQEAQQAELRVRQRENEANQTRAVAAGERDANISRAQGQAQAIVLRAQAEAEALRLVSEQIAANPSLIQYLYVQNLSENVNLALVPANSPFLFDFNSLADANSSFRAPNVPQVIEPVAEATELP